MSPSDDSGNHVQQYTRRYYQSRWLYLSLVFLARPHFAAAETLHAAAEASGRAGQR